MIAALGLHSFSEINIGRKKQQRFTMGTWNVRDFEPEKDEILEVLSVKKTDSCGFQQTKRDVFDDFCQGYWILLFKRANEYGAQGFAPGGEREIVEYGL